MNVRARLRRIERHHREPIVTARQQHDFAERLARCYGDPATPPPERADFRDIPAAEWDAMCRDSVERAYGVEPCE